MTPAVQADPALQAIAAAAADDAGGIDVDLLDDFLAVLAAAVASGTRLSRAALNRYVKAGQEAAARGVALRALVDLYLSAAVRLWSHLPSVQAAERDPQAVVRAGEVMLRARRRRGGRAGRGLPVGAPWSGRSRRRPPAASSSTTCCSAARRRSPGWWNAPSLFGLHLAGPHAVVVVKAEQPFADSSPLTAILERSILGSKADADALVTTKDGHLVVIFAAPDRAAIDGVIDGLTGSLPAGTPGVHLRRVAQVGAWRMGVGQAHQGPAGVRLSFAQAQEALALGARLGAGATVTDAADLLLYRVLVRDETAMRELIDEVLTPLTAARGGAEPLLQHAARRTSPPAGTPHSARAILHLSVRALTYRLTKIAELTGRDPADPAQRFELQTAVAGARLLGWPATPRD